MKKCWISTEVPDGWHCTSSTRKYFYFEIIIFLREVNALIYTHSFFGIGRKNKIRIGDGGGNQNKELLRDQTENNNFSVHFWVTTMRSQNQTAEFQRWSQNFYTKGKTTFIMEWILDWRLRIQQMVKTPSFNPLIMKYYTLGAHLERVFNSIYKRRDWFFIDGISLLCNRMSSYTQIRKPLYAIHGCFMRRSLFLLSLFTESLELFSFLYPIETACIIL